MADTLCPTRDRDDSRCVLPAGHPGWHHWDQQTGSRPRGGPDLSSRSPAAVAFWGFCFVLGWAAFLLLLQIPSAPGSANWLAMTVIVVSLWTAALLLGGIGLAGVVWGMVGHRPSAPFWVGLAVVGWIAVSCGVPLAV